MAVEFERLAFFDFFADFSTTSKRGHSQRIGFIAVHVLNKSFSFLTAQFNTAKSACFNRHNKYLYLYALNIFWGKLYWNHAQMSIILHKIACS